MRSDDDIYRTNAALYGAGVFTTVAVSAGEPILWEKHWRRLTSNAGKLGIDLSNFSSGSLLDRIAEHIRSNGLSRGRVRVTLHDERQAELWRTDNNARSATKLSVITGEDRSVPGGFRVALLPFPVNSHSPLAGVKSCNYLEPQLCLSESRSRGFHEGLRLNEAGAIASACMANVFWLKDGKLFTPALSTGCLAGTTREFILENVDCRETIADVLELAEADAIFLTSAGLGIVQVFEFNGRQFGSSDHPILRLNEIFRPRS